MDNIYVNEDKIVMPSYRNLLQRYLIQLKNIKKVYGFPVMKVLDTTNELLYLSFPFLWIELVIKSGSMACLWFKE